MIERSAESTGAAAKLVLEIERTRSVTGACAALLKFAVEECGLARAAALVEIGDQVRGVRQDGSGQPVERLSIELNDIDPRLLDALHGPASTVLRTEGPAAPGLDYGSYLIFPLPGFDGDPVGAVVADEDGFDRDRDVVERLFFECGAAMGRAVELEEIDRRYREVSRQRKLLASMVDALPDPVLLTDEDNRIVISNRRANELFVSHPEDAEGRRRAVEMNNLFFTSHLTEAVISGAAGQGLPELDLADPEYGSDLSFEVLTYPVSLGEEARVTRITVLRDITDLKKALAELEKQISQAQVAEHRAVQESSRLEAIIENLGEPILVTDQRSNIVRMNPEAECLFEVEGEEAAGSAELKAVRENDAKITGVMSDFLLHDEQRRSTTVELQDPESGEPLPTEVVSTKVRDQKGELSTVVSILRDLRPLVENERLARELRELNEQLEQRVKDATSELEDRNRELEEQRRQLEKASRAKSEFLASVSHELRTPINAILGYTSLIQERIYGDLSDEQDRALDKVRVASRQLLSLISDILDLSKIEAGRLPVAVETFTLANVIEELEETIEPMVRDAELTFEKVVPETSVDLETDRTKLQQILLNLLTNAVKFTDEGFVSFRSEILDGDRVRFQVEDTGIGIEDDELERVFDEFRQAERTREEQRGGAGLGLAIALRLAELLGGCLDAESTVGEGSTFILEIPTTIPDSALEGYPREGRS